MDPQRLLRRIILFFSVCTIVRPQQEGAVRLVNERDGVSVCGRVEIFHDGQWGTVCDDRWNTADGHVVCKQLGYLRAERIFYTAHFGRGTGPIWMDSVQCEEGASSLANCSHGGWGVHDCVHSEDAGVCCERQGGQKPGRHPRSSPVSGMQPRRIVQRVSGQGLSGQNRLFPQDCRQRYSSGAGERNLGDNL